jgi:hypothetical protein
VPTQSDLAKWKKTLAAQNAAQNATSTSDILRPVAKPKPTPTADILRPVVKPKPTPTADILRPVSRPAQQRPQADILRPVQPVTPRTVYDVPPSNIDYTRPDVYTGAAPLTSSLRVDAPMPYRPPPTADVLRGGYQPPPAPQQWRPGSTADVNRGTMGTFDFSPQMGLAADILRAAPAIYDLYKKPVADSAAYERMQYDTEQRNQALDKTPFNPMTGINTDLGQIGRNIAGGWQGVDDSVRQMQANIRGGRFTPDNLATTGASIMGAGLNTAILAATPCPACSLAQTLRPPERLAARPQAHTSPPLSTRWWTGSRVSTSP